MPGGIEGNEAGAERATGNEEDVVVFFWLGGDLGLCWRVFVPYVCVRSSKETGTEELQRLRCLRCSFLVNDIANVLFSLLWLSFSPSNMQSSGPRLPMSIELAGPPAGISSCDDTCSRGSAFLIFNFRDILALGKNQEKERKV